ncbi:MAG: acyltransferase [Clostridia bacterium]|nr:acyltransferase [Clostridia bacterium]
MIRLFSWIKNIKKTRLKKANPLEYAKRAGVNFPEGGVHVYGQIFWSTEPWIISIGNNVYLTDGVKFLTHDGGTLLFRDRVPDLEITKPIVIGNNVYVGNNVIILPGVTIGNNCVIGAGAVVSRDIPDNSVAVGVPARVIKTIDEYFLKLQCESLHLGHLKGEEKDRALKKYYGYSGDSKGIYF